MENKMDEIDSKQQLEIDQLKNIDIVHDRINEMQDKEINFVKKMMVTCLVVLMFMIIFTWGLVLVSLPNKLGH